MKFEFEPKPVHRLRQQVEEQILEGIVSGRLTDGAKLPAEAELAAMFSVSRSTVREALRSLVAAGLIEKTSGATGGSFVRRLDAKRFGSQLADLMKLLVDVGSAQRAEIAAVRAMLEVPAGRLAAEFRSDADLEVLRSLLEREKVVPVSPNETSLIGGEFHGAIAAASGNIVLSALVRAFHSTTEPVRLVQISEEAGRATVQQHADILRAVEARDPDEAERAIRMHLDYLDELRAEAHVPRSRAKNASEALFSAAGS